jgi:hypothetical protein
LVGFVVVQLSAQILDGVAHREVVSPLPREFLWSRFSILRFAGKSKAGFLRQDKAKLLGPYQVAACRLGANDETLRPFLDLGIAGLQSYAHTHDEATPRLCLDWCNRHDLPITGDLDSHGGA